MRGNESFCEYLGVLLDRHQSPDCQPHRPLPVDVEVLDVLPQSSHLPLQTLQTRRVMPSYFLEKQKIFHKSPLSFAHHSVEV